MNKQKPLISIIIPCYNVSEFLPELFKSLEEGVPKNAEVVFVDDKSSDDSLLLIEGWTGTFKNSSVVKNSVNMGLSNTRDKGIEASLGEYIYFLDGDDILDKSFVNVCSFLINKKEVYRFRCKNKISLKKNMTLGIQVSNYLIKKSFFTGSWFNPKIIYEDNHFAGKISSEMEKRGIQFFEPIPIVPFTYRIGREGSLSNSKYGKNVFIDSLEMFKNDYSKNESPWVKAYAFQLFISFVYYATTNTKKIIFINEETKIEVRNYLMSYFEWFKKDKEFKKRIITIFKMRFFFFYVFKKWFF